MGFFTQIKEKLVGKSTKQNEKYVVGLDKSSETFSDRINELAARFREINDEYFEELENILIMADVGVSMVMKIVSEIKTEVRIRNITDPREINDIIVDKMFVIYANESVMSTKINYAAEGLTVILMVGVNGAGKTTLMKMICSLLTPTSGKILCDGQDIGGMGGEYRNLLGYLPQEFGFYPEFTVKDYLLYIAALKGIRPIVAKKKVNKLLAQVGLSKAANKKMRKLSGGMKRRAGIAQAILNDPKILILDEPTAGLDPAERIRFRNLISELSENRIVILSTHIVSDVEYIAKDIWLMKDGKILQQGNLDEIVSSMPQKVWACQTSHEKAAKLMKQYKVSNMKSENGTVELRIISARQPLEHARLVRPNLEDVFLYYFGEKGGDME